MQINTIYTLLIAVTALFFGGCTSSPSYVQIQGEMLGTTLNITAELDGVTPEQLHDVAMALDAEAKSSLSIYDPNSLISRINDNRTDSVDCHIVRSFQVADSISVLSSGRYDITVKPLVEAWGFAGKLRQREPNIDSLLEFVGRDKVSIQEGRIVKKDPRVQLDFNSVSKGYVVDLLAQRVAELGSENFLVDIGGEVVAQGVNSQGIAWRLGVETPFDGNQQVGAHLSQRIQLSDAAMATSGNYRRFYLDADGNKIAHTIDPQTGRSFISTLLSATVVAPTCAEADALGTMLMAMGTDLAIEFSQQNPELGVYLIIAGQDGEYEEYISASMQGMIMD